MEPPRGPIGAMSHDPLPHLPRTVLSDCGVLINASTRRSRLIGLTGMSALAEDRALLLTRCRSIHTVGMAFALDLVWLDASGRPIRVDSGVPPWRMRTCRRARSVVEAAAGSGERWSAALHQAAGGSGRSGSSDADAPPAETGVAPEDRSAGRLPSSEGGWPS